MPTVQEQTYERIRGFRQYLHREAGERVWSVGGALRVNLNNFSVDALKDYIALSRHQFELIEFVTQRTGMDTGGPIKFEVMNWSTGKPDIWIDRVKPRTDEVPEWELEMLEDMAWRAQAMGRSLSRFEQNMTISTPADLMELSRHQCEMLNFLKTGSFRKVPGRRKARTISGGGSTPQSEERIKILGEALKEYQGRIEIKTVREFIALSKHQCELAGLLFAEYESGQPVFQVVGYEEAYGLKDKENHASGVAGVNVDSRHESIPTRFHGNHNGKVDGFGVPVGKRPRERGKCEDERFVMSEPEGRVEKRPSTARMRGDSASPGVPFCDTFGHAKVSKENPDAVFCETGSSYNGPCINNPRYESIRLDPDKTYDLPRVPMLEGNMIPLPTDGRWVRVETPDGPMAMRALHTKEPEYYVEEDVWDDDYWDHASGVAGDTHEWEEP